MAETCSSIIMKMLIIAGCLLCCFNPVVGTTMYSIYWNASNPIFRIDNTDHIINVNAGNHPWEYDQVNIVCPVYKQGEGDPKGHEQYIVYSVNKAEYDSCRITQPNPRIVAVCNQPHNLMYFTITFRSFTPTPGGLEFRPGQNYYFISTSTRSDIHRRVGGACSSLNMKMVFEVAPDSSINDVDSNNSLPQNLYHTQVGGDHHHHIAKATATSSAVPREESSFRSSSISKAVLYYPWREMVRGKAFGSLYPSMKSFSGNRLGSESFSLPQRSEEPLAEEQLAIFGDDRKATTRLDSVLDSINSNESNQKDFNLDSNNGMRQFSFSKLISKNSQFLRQHQGQRQAQMDDYDVTPTSSSTTLVSSSTIVLLSLLSTLIAVKFKHN